MWFKNLLFYRFTRPFDLTAEILEEALNKDPFLPCGKHEHSRFGWTSPLGKHSEQLCHASNGFFLLRARKEERLLPASVVKELTQEKVSALEAKEDRKIYRKERETLKEEVIHENLPRAFTRQSDTTAFLDPQGWLVVDSSSYSKAEALINQLRESLGTLGLALPQVVETPSKTMTHWLQSGSAGERLIIGDECELREAVEDGSVVRCKRHDLFGDEIHAHLENGKNVAKLAVTWNDQLQCLIHDDLSIKRLKFTDLITAEAEDAGQDNEAALLDASFNIMALTLRQFREDLWHYFGGLQNPES